MVFCRQVNFFILLRLMVAAILLTIVAGSCTVPRRYVKGKPFIYRSTVELENVKLSNSEKQQLKAGLLNQMDDSLKVRTVVAVGWPLIYNRLTRPPVFDSLYVGRSKTYMAALLKSQGYFYPVIKDTFRIDTIKDQQRVHVKFTVSPGRALKYDSIGYDLSS